MQVMLLNQVCLLMMRKQKSYASINRQQNIPNNIQKSMQEQKTIYIYKAIFLSLFFYFLAAFLLSSCCYDVFFFFRPFCYS